MKTTTLRGTQLWFQRLVMQRPLDDPTGESSGADCESPLNSSHGLAAEQRLAIYQDAYLLRLLECLREEFPRVRSAVGEDAFHSLAAAYLDEHPSTSNTLGRLSCHFEAFLQRTRPLRTSEHPDWYDLVTDAARFDLAVQRVFDGPGWESSTISTVRPLTQADARFAPFAVEVCPSVELLTTRCPVGDLRPNLSAPELCKLLQTTVTTNYALHRRNFEVRFLHVDEPSLAMLRALQAGSSLTDVVQIAVAHGLTNEDSLKVRFVKWSAEGLLRLLAS